ncbi:MAG: histidinol-phosphate transaminase [Deltaproteobacteria bacterium]|nr:histidinol-phosphate transaminase [Deltaproteobacteria bacterium]
MPEAFVPPHVQHLDAYQPGKPIEELERELGISGAIKVASNENPLGPSPKALAALPGALSQLHLYPDAGGFALRRALATRYDLDPGQLALGNGSNDLLYQLVLATCEPTDEVLSHAFGFLSYRLSAQVAGRTFVAAKPTPALACDVDSLIAAITPRTKLVVLGTPNNPTGTVITRAGMQQVLAALPARALLVIDEAYAEYAAAWPDVDHADGFGCLRADRRVVVLRTFSKIYGLAGLRVGFAAADPSVVDVLGRVNRTFHVSTLAQVGALAALDDTEHVAASARHARAAIERLQAEVRGPNARVYPSLANFVLIDCGRPAAPIYDGLLRRGVIVRPMAAWGLPSCVRVSVGRDVEMPRVIAALNEILAA